MTKIKTKHDADDILKGERRRIIAELRQEEKEKLKLPNENRTRDEKTEEIRENYLDSRTSAERKKDRKIKSITTSTPQQNDWEKEIEHDYKFSHYEEDKNISSTAAVNGKYAIMICRHCGNYIKRCVF